MIDFVQILIGGLVVGATYALIAVGFSLVYQVTGVINLAQGAACVVAARQLLAEGFLKSTDRMVIYNTGSGLKYPEAYSTRFPRTAASEQDKLGGLITPR